MHRTALACTALASAALLGAAALLSAGPLDPPAGPVASSHKTLSEIEPRTPVSSANTPGDANSQFRIAQPGSYYLAGNITGVSGKSGIEIAASGVTLDLRGFSLAGVAGSVSGVSSDGAPGRVRIVNGSASGWGKDGVDLATCADVSVEHLTTNDNLSSGIRVGARGLVRGCATSNNAVLGVVAGESADISGCRSVANNGGFFMGMGSRLASSSSASNRAYGVNAGPRCELREVIAQSNTGVGFTVDDLCTLSGCSAIANTGTGFLASGPASFTSCSAFANGVGGFSAIDSGSLDACTAADNTGDGIALNNGGKVVNCLTRNNTGHGITVNFSCLVSNNNCNGDGSAAGIHGAIHVTGQANRIDSNNITYADRGVYLVSGGNAVIRNSVKGCAVNFDIAAGNDVGPIGSAAAAASPWANIQY